MGKPNCGGWLALFLGGGGSIEPGARAAIYKGQNRFGQPRPGTYIVPPLHKDVCSRVCLVLRLLCVLLHALVIRIKVIFCLRFREPAQNPR